MTRTPPRGSRRKPGLQSAYPPAAIVWTSRALADLDAVADHIARDNPGAADQWVARLVAAAASAASAPFAGRSVPELGLEHVREVLLRTCRIVYSIQPHRLEVLTVFESHPPQWYRKLLH
jgi:toxin ParE1/3/4